MSAGPHNNHHPEGWSDDRVAKLKKLWGDGLSSSQVAKQLGGVTRNAVIGKAARLGLTASAKARPGKAPAPQVRHPPTPPKSFAKAEAPAAPAAVARAPAAAAEVQPREDVRRIAVAGNKIVQLGETKPLPKERPHEGAVVELLDLRFNHCRWPIGTPGQAGFGFCGRPQHRQTSYCEEHAKLAFTGFTKWNGGTTAEFAKSVRRFA